MDVGVSLYVASGWEALEPGGFAVVAEGDAVRVQLSTGATLGIVRVPIDQLAAQGVVVPRTGTHVWPAATGASLVVRFFDGLAVDGAFRPANPSRLGRALVHILAFLCAETHARHSVSLQQLALARAKQYIETNLADLSLSPQIIAASQNMSTRSLHRLFEAEGRTIGGWIRQRRMEMCRADLCDPSLACDSVGRIGSKWGIPDAAHFSRMFKYTFGMSPREYRQKAFAVPSEPAVA